MIPWRNRIEPYEKQRQAIFDPEGNAIIEASPKSGKAQPLDALVYTTTGPVPMGKLAIGDEVLTPDGGSSPIVGIFPQGVQPIYRVTFSDGRSTECTADHLWELHMRDDKGSDWPRVAPLTEVVGLSDDYHKRCWIPTADAVNYDAQPVPIDPYLLGVLIGDGALKYGVSVSLPDDYIRERVEAAIPADHQLVYRDQYDWSVITRSHWQHHPERLHVQLRDLGLWGKGSPEKFIPEAYKYNSVEARIEMLRGLLDTDGWVDSKGQPHFDSSAKRLSDDVRELVEGLGGFAYYGIKHVAGHHDSHRLAIVHPDAPSLFALPRKRDAARPKTKPTRRKFREIELVRRAEVQCIQIAHPRGLYLTDHMITTHNTIGALQWLIEETENVSSHIDHPRFLWIAPVLTQAEIAFMRAYQEVLKFDDVELHKTNRTITLPEGPVIVFRSAERPDLIYGEDYYGIVIDEASDMKEDAWHAAISTTNHTEGRFRIITNVRNRRNWAYRLARRVEKGELDGWEHFQLTQDDAIDAGIVKTGTDTHFRALLDESIYRMTYHNETGLDFELHLAVENIDRLALPETVTWCRAWDFAATETGDWTVGAKVAGDHEGFWITDIVRERVGPEAVIDLIRQTAAVDGPEVDQVVEEEKGSSGKLFLETIRQQLYQIPTAGPVWPAGVEQNKLVRAWPMVVEVGQGRWHLAPDFNASELMPELEAWPDSRYDDQVDALAHARNHLAPMVQGFVGSGWVAGQTA